MLRHSYNDALMPHLIITYPCWNYYIINMLVHVNVDYSRRRIKLQHEYNYPDHSYLFVCVIKSSAGEQQQ